MKRKRKRKSCKGSTGLIYESSSPAAQNARLARRVEQVKHLEALGRTPGKPFIPRTRLRKQDGSIA